MRDILQSFLDNGLLQFGSFAGVPYQWNLEYLPSYPLVLEQLAELAAAKLYAVDHLVCTAYALPFATALSLKSHIPLVYGNGAGGSGKPAIVGAYDIGHPAVLVMDKLTDEQALLDFINYAAVVGLEVQQVIIIVQLWPPARIDIHIDALLDMHEVITELYAHNQITPFQYEAVQRWLISHRPDSAAP